MQRHNPQMREQQMIREASASVTYHYPEYTAFADDLRDVLAHPTPENWLLAGKVLNHMGNYHRKKILKKCSEIFADIDLFNLMLCAFIPEADTAEIAMHRVPKLRNQQEYEKLLTVIPEADLKKFIKRANAILPYDTQSKPNLELQPLQSNTAKTEHKSSWNPATLLAAFAALYMYKNDFSIAWPILSCMTAIFFAKRNMSHKTERTPAFSSIWASTTNNKALTQDTIHRNYLSHS